MGKRVRRSLSNVWAIAIALLGIFAIAVPVNSQTSQPADKKAIVEEIEKEIKGYAERHVENETSMQTKVMLDLYRDNQVGLTPRDIAKIYEEEYDRLKKAKEWNLWDRLNPTGGWIVASILFVVLLFRDVVKDWISNFFKAIGLWGYHRFAGTPLFHNFSLKRYRQALLKKYQQLHVPFRPTRPLQMREIYVPLKVAGSSDTQQIDADRAVAEHHKLMVIGPPGSGKSMLLKYIALNYAEDRLLELPEQPIAIFLELHRLSDPEKSLKQHLVEALDRDYFPKAERFVSQGLKSGKLMLLLDGLDEVNSSERPRVIQEIRDLLDQLDDYKERCRVIITCRTAIYQGEFDDRVDRTLEVVEFQDWQIRQFLEPWASDMPKNKSIEHLMQTLRDRPRIMALARNPLLLTIIAYLYTDTPFVLPHSRAEFYEQATNILLDMWHQEHNCYKAREKRSVLKHLALYFQDNANRQQQDRRSVDYRQVLTEVAKVLPEINVNSEDGQPLLQEIVERSGLLLEIDGGDRYQFAHLTLQEYFAAAALRENGAQLVDRFKKDPEAWRETVKLWCGLAADSTKAIESIYAQDPITAFECLADAQTVNPQLATEIIESFKEQLSHANKDDQIIRAFAAVAADKRPRGEETFKFLEKTLTNQDPTSRSAAAQALSLSNLPDAARVLANHYKEIPELREHLVSMGDLAVSALGDFSAQGSHTAMDCLLAIATPNAAKEFASLLWKVDDNLAVRAAWRLAALLPQPNIEDGLRDCQIAEEYKKQKWLDWIWEPFEEPDKSALPIIAGRIAYLISEVSFEVSNTESSLELDPRLIVPICAIDKRGEIDITALKKFEERISELKQDSDQPTFTQRQVHKILTDSDISLGWQKIVFTQTLSLQVDLLARLINYRLPTINDWLNVFRPVKYDFRTGWHYLIILSVANFLSIVALAYIGLIFMQKSTLFLTVLVSWMTCNFIFLLSKELEPKIFLKFGFFGIFSFLREWFCLFNNIDVTDVSRYFNENETDIWSQSHSFFWAGYLWFCYRFFFGEKFYNIYNFSESDQGIILFLVGISVLVYFNSPNINTKENNSIKRLKPIMLFISVMMIMSSLSLEKKAIIQSATMAIVLVWLISLAGVGFWINAKYLGYFGRFLAVLAAPFFCGFPIVVYFATLAMLNFGSWQQVALTWPALIGSCTVLWVIGKKRDYKARNPFHGIIPNPKTAGKPSDKNPKKRSFAFWPLRN